MLNITDHQGNTNHNCDDITSHLSDGVKSTTQEKTAVSEDVEWGNPLALLVGMQIGAAILEKSLRFLKELEIELPYDPAIRLLGICPKNTKILIQRDTCT